MASKLNKYDGSGKLYSVKTPRPESSKQVVYAGYPSRGLRGPMIQPNDLGIKAAKASFRARGMKFNKQEYLNG